MILLSATEAVYSHQSILRVYMLGACQNQTSMPEPVPKLPLYSTVTKGKDTKTTAALCQ